MIKVRALKSFPARKAGEIDGAYPRGDVPAIIKGEIYNARLTAGMLHYKIENIEHARYPSDAFEQIK